MQPFIRPESQMREYEIVLAELNDLIKDTKTRIQKTRESILENEEKLAELLSDDEIGAGIKKQFEDLFSRWSKTNDELKTDSENSELKAELSYIEEELEHLTNYKHQVERLEESQNQKLREEIQTEIHYLKSYEEFLATWEKNKANVLNDIELIKAQIEVFKQLFESKN